MEKMLTVDEMSEKLGVSRVTIWRLNSGGKLPSPVKLGRSVRWNGAEITRWIECGCPAREAWVALKKVSKN